MQTYLFTYWWRGRSYCLEVPADSFEEAQGRVNRISHTAEYDGELVAKIPAETSSWFPELLCGIRNLFVGKRL